MYKSQNLWNLNGEYISLELDEHDGMTAVRLNIQPAKDDDCCDGWWMHLDSNQLTQLSNLLNDYADMLRQVELREDEEAYRASLDSIADSDLSYCGADDCDVCATW